MAREKVFTLTTDGSKEQNEQIQRWVLTRNVSLEELNLSFEKFFGNATNGLYFLAGLFIAFAVQIAVMMWQEWFIKNAYYFFGGAIILVVLAFLYSGVMLFDQYKALRDKNQIMKEIYHEAKTKFKGTFSTLGE